jgi:hypothetical protein
MKNIVKGRRWIILVVVCLVTIIATTVIVVDNNNDVVVAAATTDEIRSGYVCRLLREEHGGPDTMIGLFTLEKLEVEQGFDPPHNVILSSHILNPGLDAMWDWYEDSMGQEIRLEILDEKGVVVSEYQLLDTTVYKWTISSLDGKGNDVIIELSVDLGIERVY